MRYYKKAEPTVDAMQIHWPRGSIANQEGVLIKSGFWIIVSSDGETTYCGNEYFQNNYVKAE